MRLNTKEIEKIIGGKSLPKIIKLLCGERIGFGCYRDVYILKHNSGYVVKIESDPSNGMFANVTEWRNFINNKEWAFLSDCLAPCELISEDGRVLIQRRITFKSKELYPKWIPIMFTDIKTSNFGWIGKKFVCCDYAYIPICIVQKGRPKMQKVKEWID